MHLGSGAEDTVISSGGGEGGHCQGFQRLWAPTGDGNLLQIPREGDLGNRSLLDGGGKELGLGEYGA